jgi:hypothetical protein
MLVPTEERPNEKVDIRTFVVKEGEKVINKTYRAEKKLKSLKKSDEKIVNM